MRNLLFLAVIACIAGCSRRPAEPVQLISEIDMGRQDQEHRLLRGLEKSNGGWRWTAPSFSMSLDPPPQAVAVFLEIKYTVPSELNTAEAPATLTVTANGHLVGQVRHDRTDHYLFSRRVPSEALRERPVRIECSVDRSFPNGSEPARALIVEFARLRDFDDTSARGEEISKAAAQEFRKLFAKRALKLSPEREFEFLKLFHELPVEENTWFHTIRTIKNPLDLWVAQELIHELRPDFVIETGTWRGGSALFWAQILETSGLVHSRVLTVDIQDQTAAAAFDPLWKKYVQFYLGSSTDPKIVASMAKQAAGRKVLVALDSDHSRRHVLQEIKMYGPLVSAGSYLIVEDTHLDGVPTHPEQGPGPFAAVLQFMKEGGAVQFEQDVSREPSGTSWNAGGWLRRR